MARLSSSPNSKLTTQAPPKQQPGSPSESAPLGASLAPARASRQRKSPLRPRALFMAAPFACAAYLLSTGVASAQTGGNTLRADYGAQEASEARQLAAQGRCETALSWFDKAITLRQQDASLYRDRGLCQERLGNHQPAIEDYRKYLSMSSGPAGGAQSAEAADIERRMNQLLSVQSSEKREPAEQKPEAAAAEPKLEFHTAERENSLLIGAFAGYSFWGDRGLPGESTSIGGRVGWRYSPGSELDLRGQYISTTRSGRTLGVSGATGFSITAGHIWFIDIGDTFELGMGVGGGYEQHKTKLRTDRVFLHGKFGPMLRWNFASAFNLDINIDGSLGVMSSDATAGEEQTNEFVTRFGGFAGVNWRWGASSGGSTNDADDETEAPSVRRDGEEDW